MSKKVEKRENVPRLGFFAKKNPGIFEKLLKKVLVSLRKILYNAAV